LLANLPVIRVIAGNAQALHGLQAVFAIHQQIQWHAHREVAANSGVERDQAAAKRLIQRGAIAEVSIENRPAVLALAQLQERRVRRGLEKIALRVDVVDAHRRACDLPTDDERAAQLDLFGQYAAIAHHHFAQGLGDQHRGVVERGDIQQVTASAAGPLFEQVDHRLRGGQIASGL